jgi:hypothetical protein
VLILAQVLKIGLVLKEKIKGFDGIIILSKPFVFIRKRTNLKYRELP